MSEQTYLLAAISAATTAGVHEWLHSSSITADLPELGVIGGVSSTVGSVSVGLAVAVFVGVVLNNLVYEDKI
jgi:hypothetical protein